MKIVTVKMQNGQTVVEAHGFKGTGCKGLTDAIAHAMGEPGKGEAKAEYWEPDTENLNQQDLGNG